MHLLIRMITIHCIVKGGHFVAILHSDTDRLEKANGI